MDKKILQERIAQAVRDAKATTPMTPSITNNITVNFVANAQLAAGGSAAMVYIADEAELMAKIGKALYINVGGIAPFYRETLPAAAKACCENGTPWVLDPVAIGIGEIRTEALKKFKEYKPTVVRGNATEIIALAGLWGLEGGSYGENASGVDSVDTVDASARAAAAVATWIGGAVSVSGETDLVTDGKVLIRSHGGSPFMKLVTGSGCSLGGVTAVYAAVADPLTAALTAVNVYNVAGRRAGEKTNAPGSFYRQFVDEIYLTTPEDAAENPFEVTEL